MTALNLVGQRRSDRLQIALVVFAILAVFILSISEPSLLAQVRRGSLSGTIVDPAGAVVAGAQVILTDEATGVGRQTTSNGEGFFYFAGVEPGTYTVSAAAKGFASWEAKGIAFTQAENRTLNCTLKMGAATEKIEVAAVDEVVPLATSESRTTLNNTLVTEMAVQGRNAAELIKIMPGMGMNTGLGQSQWNSYTTQTNSGPVGSFTASGGQPYGGLSMTTDGAQIVDPGNQGTQVANVNQDMTQEITLLNATYGADAAKGPVTFQAIGKSGTKDFHGSAYFYTRNAALNANDWWNNYNNIPRPSNEAYYYPGFTLGGPVIIPGTGFNKNRDKLFFFTAYEYMKQQPTGSLYLNYVPTPDMLGQNPNTPCPAGQSPCGNFTQAYLNSQFLNVGNHGGTGQVPCGAGQSSQWWYGGYCNSTEGQIMAANGGYIPVSIMDPNALALATAMPKPNRTPSANEPYNYQNSVAPPINRWEYRVRMDYNVNQKTRISGSYTWQDEKDVNTIGVWWWPGNTVPYPTGMGTKQLSRTANVSVTTVFSPTLTNDFTFGYAYFINPFHPDSASKMDPASIGYTAHGPFSPNILPAIPNMTSWGCSLGGGSNGGQGCFPIFYAPSFPKTGWANDAFGKDSRVPSFTDNVSKVLGTHTMKFGFYWDLNTNNQTEGYGDNAQGSYDFDNYNWTTTGNLLGDFVLGHGSYSQKSHIPINDIKYHQVSFYAQDQWKATRRMTLTYGLRFDHEGQWFVGNGLGISTWVPSLYNKSTTDSPQWTGLTWHASSGSVPLSGWTSPTFYYAPRVGVAYDLFGTGKTVLRGGFGVYRWQVSSNDISGGIDQPQGIRGTTCGGATLQKMADASGCAAAVFSPGITHNGNISVLQQGDNKTPYTENWTVIVSQQVPWKSTLEVQYQGNRTRNALLAGNGTNVQFYPNINKVPLGNLYGPDPVTGENVWAQSCADGRAGTYGTPTLYGCTLPSGNAYQSLSSVLHNYYPYLNYDQALIVNTHGSYSNYNAMMVSWQKQRGPLTFLTNYTFSKIMGIRDGQTNNGNGDGQINDAFNLHNNYAPLGYDHTHIFNVAYIVHLPSPVHGNPFLGGVVNGWELSGVTQVQSGAPIQPNTNGALNAGYDVSANAVFGSNGQRAMPLLLCDPRAGLRGGQYFNPNCFTSPLAAGEDATGKFIPGRNGPAVWPYIHGPAYFNNDLSLYKNFKVTESKAVQFRWNMFNFANHPLSQFGLNQDVNLSFSGQTATRDGLGGYIAPTSCSFGAPECNNNKFTTGKPFGKVGRRVMELAVKFTF